MKLPRSNGKYIIDIDACDTQVRCNILQEQENEIRSLLVTGQVNSVKQNDFMK